MGKRTLKVYQAKEQELQMDCHQCQVELLMQDLNMIGLDTKVTEDYQKHQFQLLDNQVQHLYHLLEQSLVKHKVGYVLHH